MQLNGTLVVILGLVVFALGWLMKRGGLQLEDRVMFWLIAGISLVGGAVQVVVSAQLAAFPPVPSDPAQVIFVWVPTVLGWIAVSAGAVLAASQLVFGIIMKGLKSPPRGAGRPGRALSALPSQAHRDEAGE